MEPCGPSQAPASPIRHRPRSFPQRGSLSGRGNNRTGWPRSRSRSRSRCRRFGAWSCHTQAHPRLSLMKQLCVPLLSISQLLSSLQWGVVTLLVTGLVWGYRLMLRFAPDWAPDEGTYSCCVHEDRARPSRPQTNHPLLDRNRPRIVFRQLERKSWGQDGDRMSSG